MLHLSKMSGLMSDYEKIKAYYTQFDEWGRLDAPEGLLEREIMMQLIGEYVDRGATILDLGGGPGRYTCALSQSGYHVHLADLSPALVEIARTKVKEHGNAAFIKSIMVTDATDLSAYASGSMDAVLLLGPLYHLTTSDEIVRCLGEVHRVLRAGGILIAAYIPRLSGLRSVLARMLYRTGQADTTTLQQVADTGVFHNLGEDGFQEGQYLTTDLLLDYMSGSCFEQLLVRSVRGLGNGMEAGILACKDKDRAQYERILELIHQTAADQPVIDSSGHAVYIGRKA